jgi:hypothetical protein
MALLRDDQFLIHVGVDGVAFPSAPSGWSSCEGGDVTAPNTGIHPGGMFPEIKLGGVPTRSDVTVKRPYSTALHAYVVQLENVAGRAPMSVSFTPLDANGNPAGGTITMTGKLDGVQRPNYDASSTGNAAYLTLIMGANLEASISQ